MGSSSSRDSIPNTELSRIHRNKRSRGYESLLSTMFWGYFIYCLLFHFKLLGFLWHALNPLFPKGPMFWISRIPRGVLATRSWLMFPVWPHNGIRQDCVWSPGWRRWYQYSVILFGPTSSKGVNMIIHTQCVCFLIPVPLPFSCSSEGIGWVTRHSSRNWKTHFGHHFPPFSGLSLGQYITV